MSTQSGPQFSKCRTILKPVILISSWLNKSGLCAKIDITAKIFEIPNKAENVEAIVMYYTHYQMTHIKMEKAVKQTLLSNCTTSIFVSTKNVWALFSLRISKYVLAMTNSYAILLNYSKRIFLIFSKQLTYVS